MIKWMQLDGRCAGRRRREENGSEASMLLRTVQRVEKKIGADILRKIWNEPLSLVWA